MSEKDMEPSDAAAAQPGENRLEIDRRRFLGGVGIAAGTLAGGLTGLGALNGSVEAAAKKQPPVKPAPGVPARLPVSGPERLEAAYQIRLKVAEKERSLGLPKHVTNGDESRYPTRVGNFSKTLPHNELGEVDPGAYQSLQNACTTGGYAELEAIPQGGRVSYQNPAGGLAFTLEGPDSAAIAVPPPPAIASAEWAGQIAECYWMALLRDVPFAEYPDHPLVKQACEDLSQLKGNFGPRDPQTGRVTPKTLFRSDFPGATEGPIVSQFLYSPFLLDGIRVQPKISTAAPGVDFLTSFPEFLEAQNGFPKQFPVPEPRDTKLRYVRNGRDLARVASQDSYFSQYYRALLVLSQLGIKPSSGNPYSQSKRQGGFATFGEAYSSELLGAAHVERNVFYVKWHVHRYLRPEQGGALVHNVKTKKRDYPLHADLFEKSAVLPLIFEHNRKQNNERLKLDEGSYLMPQLLPFGCPTHPSYVAAHAGVAGSCITMLKSVFDTSLPFPNPMQASPDGTELVPYVAGKDGPPLTVLGELHKLAHNVSLGRNIMGVHWRCDSEEGLILGEQVAMRLLSQNKATFAEPFQGHKIQGFRGQMLTA